MSLLSAENNPFFPVGRQGGGGYSPGEILFSQLEERAPKESNGNSQADGGWFDLSAPVGRSGENKHRDVLRVESLLGQTGHYDIAKLQGPTGLWGMIGDKAVKAFQKENGLKVDGILNPCGPTIMSLKRQVENIFKGWSVPTPQEVGEHHDSLARGGRGTLSFGRPPIRMVKAGDIDHETASANRRTLDYLSRYADNQGLDLAAAQHIASGDGAAIPRYRHLIERMAEREPRRAHDFAWGIIDNLPTDRARAFLGGDVPLPRPVGLRRSEWEGRRTLELRQDEMNPPPSRVAPYDPRRDDPGAIGLLADDDADRRKNVDGDGGDAGGDDAPLDLRDDQADPPEQGAGDKSADDNDEPPPISEEPQTNPEEEKLALAEEERQRGAEDLTKDKSPEPTDEPKAKVEEKGNQETAKPQEAQGGNKPVSKEFLEKIWGAEQAGRKVEDRTTDDKAKGSSGLGKYQITKSGLQDIGWKDKKGNWTAEAKRNGVSSDEDFQKKVDAQEKAAQRYFDRKDAALKKVSETYRGKEIDGIAGKFKITDAGLAAAAHRDGQGVLESYLRHQQKNGWKSDFSKIDPDVARKWRAVDGQGKERTASDRFRAIETRLRTFEKVKYR